MTYQCFVYSAFNRTKETDRWLNLSDRYAVTAFVALFHSDILFSLMFPNIQWDLIKALFVEDTSSLSWNLNCIRQVVSLTLYFWHLWERCIIIYFGFDCNIYITLFIIQQLLVLAIMISWHSILKTVTFETDDSDNRWHRSNSHKSPSGKSECILALGQ